MIYERAVSEKLQKVKIICGDYRVSADFIDENTFVCFDPPYRPITDTASFTAYMENLFNNKEQFELARFVDDMHRKGAKVVISNYDPKNSNTEDDFFDNIYSPHRIKRVEATRMINCNSEVRGKNKELLISIFRGANIWLIEILTNGYQVSVTVLRIMAITLILRKSIVMSITLRLN